MLLPLRYKLWFKARITVTELVIIMTYPSYADELIFDRTTMLVRNGAVKNDFGSVSIINQQLNCSTILYNYIFIHK
ncbi:DUF1643 domain-containing protein [Ruminococcus sp. AF42-10]|nr:DUF1643 domain-containing protein [Ruminococcus sp. AF42-10]